MPGLIVMGALTCALASALFGGVLWATSRGERRLLWLLAAALPLSALANLALKRPLAMAMASASETSVELGPGSPASYVAFAWLLSPVVEEGMKLAPLLLPRLGDLAIRRTQPALAGAAVGFGYGIGEAAYLAVALASRADFVDLPWFAFTGFLGERLAACFAHGVLTAVVVTGLARGWARGAQGLAAAIGLHALTNVGAVLARVGIVSAEIAAIWLLVVVIGLAFIFEALRRATTPSSPATTLLYRRPEAGWRDRH